MLTSPSSTATARYSPPRERTCSATSGRGSVARTTAPSDPAAPIAASPATPAPATSTFAGGTLPAAVTCPVKNRPNSCAASITARYPAMLAIELSTSSDWAREIRGTASIDSAVIGWRASTSTMSGFSAGASSATSIAPGFICASSSSDGVLMANTMSACHASPMVAPASTKPSSGRSARSPAPAATTTS